jgi:MFS family permease
LKNKAALIILLIANAISGVAQGVSVLAIPWFFARNDQMETFGLYYVVVSILSFFWVPYCGTLIDKYDRKKIFLGITSVCGILIGLVALIGHMNGNLPSILVASVFAITFLNFNIHYPSLYAFVQEITEARYYGRITSIIEIAGQMTTMMAGALGALLLEGNLEGKWNLMGYKVNFPIRFEAWEIYEIFTLDALTYLASFLLILSVRYVPLIARSPETGAVFTRLKIGFKYLKQEFLMFVFGVSTYAVFIVILVEGFFLSAMYVNNHLGAFGDTYAISGMYYALGAIFSGVFIRYIFKRSSIPMSIIYMTIIGILVCLMIAWTKSILLFMLAMLFYGITNAGIRIQRVTYLFKNVPNQVYGRAGSVFFLINIICRVFFLGLFSIPFFSEDNNVIHAFVILALFLLAAVVIQVKYKRRFEEYEGSNTVFEL